MSISVALSIDVYMLFINPFHFSIAYISKKSLPIAGKQIWSKQQDDQSHDQASELRV